MKKVLLGTSALAAMALVAGTAQAQDLTITGNVDWNVGVSDESGGNSSAQNYGMRSDTYLRFSYSNMADNGLRYGGVIDLDDARESVTFYECQDDTTGAATSPLYSTNAAAAAACSAGSSAAAVTDAETPDFDIDEAYLYLSGSWGEVRLGNKEGAAENFRGTYPSVGNGNVGGDWRSYVTGGTPSVTNTLPIIGGFQDATRISYYNTGQAVDGLDFGVSYAPNVSDHVNLGTNLTGNPQDQFDFGGNYTIDFDGGSAILFATAGFADAGTGREDIFEYSLAARVSFGGFSAGGYYINSGDSNMSSTMTGGELENWGLGATYSIDGWGFGIGYRAVDDTRVGNGAPGDGYAIGGDVNYSLAPGLNAYATILYFDDQPGSSSNDGVVGLAGATASF